MAKRAASLAFLVGLALAGQAHASADAGRTASIPPQKSLTGTLSGYAGLYRDYVARFVMADGRVIDNVNGNISHSESQGYGMLLALAAGDRETFSRIWSFTDTNLYVRDDGLASWRWAPEGGQADAQAGAITDPNNASDGDLLIAWALAEAGALGWDPAYSVRADAIVSALERVLTRVEPFGLVMMPGREGFAAEDRERAGEAALPVVNLSYWVFPAFDRLAVLHPRPFWAELQKSGKALLRAGSDNASGLAPDWLALDAATRKAVPAGGFADNGFSYNAIRVPLYLALAERSARRELRAGFEQWFRIDGPLWTVDVEAGRGKVSLGDPGYEILRAVYGCATRGAPVPESLRAALDTNYYPATLQLLGLAGIAMRYPECL